MLFTQPLLFEEVEVLHEALQETWCVLLVVAECAQDEEDAEAALAGNASTSGWVLAGLVLDIEFEPFTTLWVDGAFHQLVLGEVTQTVTLSCFKDHAWRTHELRNNDLFDAVHEERATLGHLRELTDVDDLFFDFTRIAVGKTSLYEARHRVGVMLDTTFSLGEFWPRCEFAIVGIKFQLELQTAVSGFNWRDVREHILQAVAHEPLEAVFLHRQEVGHFQNFFE